MGTNPTKDVGSDPSDADNVFADTNIFLNYIQRGVEPDLTSDLIEGDQIDVVIGVTVAEELEEVSERRADIYTDFLDYLLEGEGEIANYDPTSRRPYFQGNDLTHIRSIQERLAQIDDRAEVQRRLRHFVRAIKRRLQFLHEEIIPDSRFDRQPGLTLIFDLEPIIQNRNDTKVVADAALWAAESEDSSGIFVTNDKGDFLDLTEKINQTLQETKDETWMLTIIPPTNLPVKIDRETTLSS